MILTVEREINVESFQAYLGCICQSFYDREIEFGQKKFNSIEEWRERVILKYLAPMRVNGQ